MEIPRRGRVLSFLDKKLHSREFPVHSLRFTSLYDIDQLGQRYVYTNADNLFLSLKRMEDARLTYQRRQQLEYTLELRNNFSLVASAAFERQEGTRWIPFVNGHGQSFGHYNEAMFELKLRYAPEKSSTRARLTACQSTSTHRYSNLPTHLLRKDFGEHVHHQPHRVALPLALVALGIRLHRCSCRKAATCGAAHHT